MRLSLGFLRDGKLACPYHGWRFDADGHDRSVGQTLASIAPGALHDGLDDFLNPHLVFDMSELVRYVVFRERVHDRGLGGR